jgi:hypothetical protein
MHRYVLLSDYNIINIHKINQIKTKMIRYYLLNEEKFIQLVLLD